MSKTVDRMRTPATPSGKRLRKARQAAGHTQAQAAKKLGISQAHYSRVETGVSGASEALAGRIARRYAVAYVVG